MKTNQNKSFFVRGLLLVVAFAMAVISFPVNALGVFAEPPTSPDHTFITIGSDDQEVDTTVTTGESHKVADAYIGGVWKIGDASNNNKKANDGTTELVSSSVDVTYNGAKVDFDAAQGTFKAENVGTYTVTYSYTVKEESGTQRTYKYSMKVESTLSSYSINFDSNDKNFLPSIIDAQFVKDTETEKTNLYLSAPKILDKDGEEVAATTNFSEPEDKKSYVVVTVQAPGVGTLTKENGLGSDERGLYVSAKTLKEHAGNYTITYSYYSNGRFITSVTRTTRVYGEGENEKYYKDGYELVAELASTFVDDGETGVASKLPAATGKTSSSTTPSNESVDVYYRVKAQYASSVSQSYADLDKTLYNKDHTDGVLDENGEVVKEVVDEEGYLVDPTTFKPLQDGNYQFLYEVTDFYDNKKTIGDQVFEYKNVIDETNPTVLIYDASLKEKGTPKSAVSKAKTYSYPNAVVVYAVGMSDNVSKSSDVGSVENVELYRDLKVSSTNSIYKIEKFHNKNLVFNYRNDGTSAYENLLAYNYLIRQKAGEITSDAQMLQWLNANEYMIVVDNANYKHIYDLFKDATTLVADQDAFNPLKDFAALDDAAEAALAWFKTDEAANCGFAYLDMDKTFGATSADGGRSETQFYVQYYAKDAAGRTSTTSITMRISQDTSLDYEQPTITFSGTLSDYYLPTATVTFAAPTAEDNRDGEMVVSTLYRYLDDAGNVVQVKDKKGENKETVSLKQLADDIDLLIQTNGSNADFYKNLKKNNSKYLAESKYDGWMELSNQTGSTYSIKLSEAGDTATTLQILSYVYDDAGNLNIYAKDISISNDKDSKAPKLGDVSAWETQANQYGNVQLPSMTVWDDLIPYVSYSVQVEHIDSALSRTEMKSTGASHDTKMGQNKQGRIVINGGQFNASFAGEYQISLIASDAKNRTIVKFYSLDVEEKFVFDDPTVSQTFTARTVQLDDIRPGTQEEAPIELPTPSVSYEISKSVTYDQFVYGKGDVDEEGNEQTEGEIRKEYTKGSGELGADPEEYTNTDYVVLGADANGNASNWTITTGKEGKYDLRGNLFIPKEIGEYDIVFHTRLIAYNYKVLTYTDADFETMQEDVFKGKVNGDADDYTISVVNENEYNVTKGVDTYNVVRSFIKDENGQNSKAVYTLTQNGESSNAIADTVLDKIFTLLQVSDGETTPVRITVEDTKLPEIIEEGRYADLQYMTREELEAKGRKIDIYAMQYNEYSVDPKSASITISWSLANGRTDSAKPKIMDGETAREATGVDCFKDGMYFDGFGTGNPDGIYTITYSLKDKYNSTAATRSYEIKIGDNTAPTITAPDGLKDKYSLDDATITIDLDSFTAADDYDGTIESSKIEFVSLVNTSNTTAKIDPENENQDDRQLVFKLTEVGTYRLTLQVKDTVGNTCTWTKDFTVESVASNPVPVYQVIGTVLIVVSVLLLAGVIIYFIVSKVKLDKELKK